MQVESRKNRKLRKQYPFVDLILGQHMEPHRTGFEKGKEMRSVDGLTIRVQKADGDLMYRRGHNIGLGEDSLSFSTEGKHKGQVAKRGEYVFAVDKHGQIINRLNWPRNDEEARGLAPVYAHNVLWRSKSADGRLLSNPIYDEVVYMVWATVETWHIDTRKENDGGLGGRFGECVERIVEITIYGAPDDGFRKLHEKSSHWSNLRLDTRVLTRAMFDKDLDLMQMLGCLWELCKFFQDEVWDGGMKQAFEGFEKAGVRGAIGQFGSAKVLVAEMMDYHRVMLENDSCYISFQLRPSGIDMYVLGEDGTLPQLRRLVRGVIKTWIMHPECHANFKADAKVSVM